MVSERSGREALASRVHRCTHDGLVQRPGFRKQASGSELLRRVGNRHCALFSRRLRLVFSSFTASATHYRSSSLVTRNPNDTPKDQEPQKPTHPSYSTEQLVVPNSGCQGGFHGEQCGRAATSQVCESDLERGGERENKFSLLLCSLSLCHLLRSIFSSNVFSGTRTTDNSNNDSTPNGKDREVLWDSYDRAIASSKARARLKAARELELAKDDDAKSKADAWILTKQARRTVP